MSKNKAKSIQRQPNQPTAPEPNILAIQKKYSGPLPPPEQLEHYERISPGYAQAILQMAVKEQESIHAMREGQLEIAKEELALVRWGQRYGFAFGAIALAASTFLISTGQSATGIGILVSGLATLVGSFFYKKSKER